MKRTLASIKEAPITNYKSFVAAAERYMMTKEQAPANVIHSFGPGVYIREVTLKKGSFCIGQYQRYEHQNIVIKGAVRMLHEDGSTSIVKGPTMFVGKPGQKVGYALEDTVWLNVYATEERDVDVLEAMFIDKSYSPALSETLQKLLTGNARARLEYSEAVDACEIGRTILDDFTEEVDFPTGSYYIKIGQSSIHGTGVLATADITARMIVCDVVIGGKKTPAGRYINHSDIPNCAVINTRFNNYSLISLTNIEGSRGGIPGAELTIDYRKINSKDNI
jgi:hypothetical protein